MNARVAFASKVITLKGELSFRDLSKAILEKTGCYISHSTLYQYSLSDGKSPSPENLDILAKYAGKSASWFFEDSQASQTPLPSYGNGGLLVQHLLVELQGIYDRLGELEKLRSDAGQLKALDADQRARMLDFVNSRTGPMVLSERKAVESYLDSWANISELLNDKASEANGLLTRIVRDFFPSLVHRLATFEDN